LIAVFLLLRLKVNFRLRTFPVTIFSLLLLTVFLFYQLSQIGNIEKSGKGVGAAKAQSGSGYVSNFRDPGLTVENWWDWQAKESCFFDNPDLLVPEAKKPLWEFSRTYMDDGSVCNSETVKTSWTQENGRQKVKISIDNSKNSQKCIKGHGNFIALQSHWILGRMKLNSLKVNDVSSLLIRGRVKLNSVDICDYPGCPQCNEKPKADYADLLFGFSAIDHTHEKNLFFEIYLFLSDKNPYPNKGSDIIQDDPWGKRILVSSDLFGNKQMLTVGNEVFYEIEISMETFRGLNWSPEVDWDNTYLSSGLYAGGHIHGNAKIEYEVSELDLLYLPSGGRECINSAKKICGTPGRIGWGEQTCVGEQWQPCEVYENYSLDLIPNCFGLSGPVNLSVGETGTYTAHFLSEHGQLSGEIFVSSPTHQQIIYQSLPGTSGEISGNWNPTEPGDYTLSCRAWNDGIAECRPAELVDWPPRYPCAGPGTQMQVKVKKAFTCSLCPGTPPKNSGNANCDDRINAFDFVSWLQVYRKIISQDPISEDKKAEVDFNCSEPEQSSYQIDLTDFKIWAAHYGKKGD